MRSLPLVRSLRSGTWWRVPERAGCRRPHDSLTQESGLRLLHPAFNHDEAQAFRSLSELRDLDAGVLLPGHDEPYRGSPASAIEQTLARL